MATPGGFVKTAYVTASPNPGASSVPVYKKLGGKYAKFYTMSNGKPASPIGQHFPVKNASGTVKKLGDFLKTNKKAKTPAPAKAPSPAKAKSPAKAPSPTKAKSPAKAKSPNTSGGFNKTNITTSMGYKVYKGPISKKYYFSYPGSLTKHEVTNTMALKTPNGSFYTLKTLPQSPSKAKAPSPTKAKSPALGPYVKTNFKFGSNKDVYKKNGEYYYYSSTGMPTLLGKEVFVTKPNGSMASLAFLNKGKSPVKANGMAGYTKTNLKTVASSLNVYKKNGVYFYKKANGQPQKLGQSVKVKKPSGNTNYIKWLNGYTKTNFKFVSHNVYKNNSGNYYYSDEHGDKPHKLNNASFLLTKPNGTSVKISNLSKTGKYMRLGDMMYFGDPVYYNVEDGKIKAYYKETSGSYIQFASLSSSIYKPTDTSKRIKIKDYLMSNNAYTPTGLSSTNGKNVYKHLDGSLVIKNGAKYTGKFKGKHAAEAMLGITKAPKAAAAPNNVAGPSSAPPPAIVSVTLVPVVRPGPDHVKAKVSEFTSAVDKVAKRLKKLQEATGGTSNKNTNYKNLCSKGNGMVYMKRTNTLKYKYSKIAGSLGPGSSSWKSLITKAPSFKYEEYNHRLSYSQYLAHQQLLLNYGRNVNSFENVRMSDMIDQAWFAAQDKYIRNLSTRDVFTISGFTFNGDQWAHAYLDGKFDYSKFRTSVKNLGSRYFAFFFQARDFYKINTGNILKDYDETVDRVKDDMNNDNIKSIIHMFINDLNEIIRKSPSVTRSFIVFRGNKDDKYLTGAVDNTYTTERFCSVTIDGETARSFAGTSDHEVQRITILKGSKCLLMFGITQLPGEWEILLPRGSTYQVVKKRQNMKTLANTNLCSTYQRSSIKNLTDVVLLGTVEEAKAIEAVPIEVHPSTNAHAMQKYIKNWPVKLMNQSIGRGGFGVVYRGTNTNLKKNVAIKFQKKSFNSNAEKAALKKLSGAKVAPQFYKNKNIIANNYLHSLVPKVKVGNQMSVMQSNFINGNTLGKWYTGAPIPKQIGNAVKNAVAKMHSRGVIHGNLHRNNIIISKANKRAYIIDFGKALVTNNSFNSPKHANAVLKTKGTPGNPHKGKNTIILPNGTSHFFNGQFINKLQVANS